MLASLKLPFTFDQARLKQDAARIRPEEWVPHFNTGVYEGEWDAVALRSTGGRTDKIYPDPVSRTKAADTEILGRCPYLQEVLGTFECAMTAARILRLKAGARIREHRDYKLGYEDGEVRIHIPIQTGSDVTFLLDRRVVPMEEGEAWYINVNLPHAVENRSRMDRLHLVIDCVVNDWLDGFFCGRESQPLEAAVTSGLEYESLERFRDLVLREIPLQEELREMVDHERFTARVLEMGKEQGCEFTRGDVRAAMQAGRRGWIERMIR